MTTGSLCTGYGGLDLAAHAVLGGRTVWTSDIDKNASRIIEARFPDAPNLGDLTTVDWSQVEPVDVLTAGYPCQPFSQAGKRLGTDDPRHIWPRIRDAIGVLRPGIVVLENVRGHLTLGFTEVVAALDALGYNVAWSLVRASDVGACHQRARVFIVARDANGASENPHPPQGSPRGAVGESDRRATADAGSTGAGRDAGAVSRTAAEGGRSGADLHAAGDAGEDTADPDLPRLEGSQPTQRHDLPAWGDYGPAICRHALAIGRPAPHPTDDAGRLDPRFVEWMMMLPAGWVTDILDKRTHSLKTLGNGVVPAQAEHAIRGLLSRLATTTHTMDTP